MVKARPRIEFPNKDGYDQHRTCARDRAILTRDHIGRNIHMLRPGDHIGWEVFYVIAHHAIVIEVKSQSIEAFHFHEDKTDGRFKVLKEEIDNSKNRLLYRFNYPSNVVKQNSPQIVFERAKECSENQKRYNFFSNNCEQFAIFCKTGNKYSLETEWLRGKNKAPVYRSTDLCLKWAAVLGVIGGSQATKVVGKAIGRVFGPLFGRFFPKDKHA